MVLSLMEKAMDRRMNAAEKAIESMDISKQDKEALELGFTKFMEAQVKLYKGQKGKDDGITIMRNSYSFSKAMYNYGISLNPVLLAKERLLKPLAFVGAGAVLTLLAQGIFGDNDAPQQIQPEITPPGYSIDG